MQEEALRLIIIFHLLYLLYRNARILIYTITFNYSNELTGLKNKVFRLKSTKRLRNYWPYQTAELSTIKYEV